MFTLKKKLAMPSAAEALPGRAQPIPTAKRHFINGHDLKGPYPQGFEKAMFGMGCFWSAERKFWELGDGIYVTAAGYAAALLGKAAVAARTGQRPGAHPSGRIKEPCSRSRRRIFVRSLRYA